MRAGGEVGAVRVKGGSRQLRAPDSEERGPVAIACRSGDFGTMRDFNTAGPGREDRFVVECKLLRSGRAHTMRKGLEQTAAYMDLSGTDMGHLVIFDMREGRGWEECVFREEHMYDGKRITVWGT